MTKKYVVKSEDAEKSVKNKFRTIDDVFAFALESDYTYHEVLFIDNTTKTKKSRKG